jgi:hypothetical protein
MASGVTYRCLEEITVFHQNYSSCYLKVNSEYCGLSASTFLAGSSVAGSANKGLKSRIWSFILWHRVVLWVVIDVPEEPSTPISYSDDVGSRFLRYHDTVYSCGWLPTFRTNILLPFYTMKIEAGSSYETLVTIHRTTRCRSPEDNLNFQRQQVLGRTNRVLSLIRYRSHWKRRVQQFSCYCVCIRYRGNVSAEPLPSNDKGIFTEPLPSNDRGVHRRAHTQTHRQQRDLISLLYVFKIRTVG